MRSTFKNEPMKRSLNLLAAAVVLVFAPSALAEPVSTGAPATTAPKMPTVTAEDMAKAQKETAALLKSEQVNIEVIKAKKLASETIRKFDPKYTGLDSPNLMLNMPKPMPGALQQRGNTDYEHLAKRFYAGVESKQEKDDLVVFVSLSMPKESLRALAEQSTRYGAVMVLRGLKNNSLKATMYAMKEIVGDSPKVNIQINPVVFTKLDVRQVPTFAILKGRDISNGDSQACAPASAFMSIAGDVPMSYALEKLAAASPPDFARIAEEHIKMGSAK